MGLQKVGGEVSDFDHDIYDRRAGGCERGSQLGIQIPWVFDPDAAHASGYGKGSEIGVLQSDAEIDIAGCLHL